MALPVRPCNRYVGALAELIALGELQVDLQHRELRAVIEGDLVCNGLANLRALATTSQDATNARLDPGQARHGSLRARVRKPMQS